LSYHVGIYQDFFMSPSGGPTEKDVLMRKFLATGALGAATAVLLTLPAAHAELTCDPGDQLSNVVDPDSFLGRKDHDGNGFYCVHTVEKRNRNYQLRYYDDY